MDISPERPGVLAAIGNTPVVRLRQLGESGSAEVWAKLERPNITAALTLARRLGPAARVATLQVDSGLNYLSGERYT